MKRFIGIAIFLCGLVTQLLAQQPAYHEALGIYKDATELLDKAKYGAAYEKFGQFIDRSTGSSFAHDKLDLLAEARFSQAVCAFNLLNANAPGLLQGFIAQYPNHARVNEALFYIGKMHYMRREYAESIEPFEKVESGNLSKQQVTESRFMLGYAYYKAGKDKEAMNKFRQIRLAEGVWGEMGAYFFAVLAYKEGNYAEAYDAFSRVKPDAKYAKDLDVLKASCLLKLQRYEELDAMGEKLLEESERASGEVFYILANAAYDRSKCSDCIDYMKKAEDKRVPMNRVAEYRLGYCLYRQADFAKAQQRFEKVVKEEDTLAQNALYYLGHCFLKGNKVENARTAFKKASGLKFDPSLAGEALFQYAKASFQTHFFDDAQVALERYIKDYPSGEYADEAKGLMGEMLLFSSDYKEAIDYLEKNDGLRSRRSQTAYQRACYLYASEMFEKHKYDVASAHYKKAFNQNQDLKLTMLAYYWYAESLFRQQAYNESASAFKTFIAQPTASRHELYPLAYYGIGWCKLSQKNFEEAGQNFEKFIGLADRDKHRDEYVDALLRAGDCEFVRKSLDGALRYYQQVRDMNGKDVDYAMLQIGLVYIRKDDQKRGAETLVNMAMTHQKSIYREQALITAAENYLSFLDDPANAAKYAQIITKDHPDSKYMPRALSVLALAESRSGNTNKAVYWLKIVATEHCYDEGARSSALKNLVDLISPEDYDEVERQSRAKCPLQNTDPSTEKAEELAIEIADQRFFDSNYGASGERYSQYLRDFPNGRYVAHAYYHRGQGYEKQGRKDDALKDYETIYKSSVPSDFTVKALKAAADIQLARGNKLAAMELYNAMQDKSSRVEDRLAAQFGKAEVDMANQDWNAAKVELLAIYNDPNTTEYSRTKAHLKIAVCNYFLGVKEEAMAVFKEIESKNTNTFGAESQYYISRILYDRQDYRSSIDSALTFNVKYKVYNYWKAKAFLVLAEDYLSLGETFQAEGTLESIVSKLKPNNEYPDVLQQAELRLVEIKSNKRVDGDAGDAPKEPDESTPKEEEPKGNNVGDMIEEGGDQR